MPEDADHLEGTYPLSVAMAENIGAKKYMEISSLENRGVRELFEEVIRLGFQAKKKKKKKCSIL